MLTSVKKYIPITTLVTGFVFQARGGIEQDVLESYCWMYSTWNIPKEYKGACSGGDQVTLLSRIRVNINHG